MNVRNKKILPVIVLYNQRLQATATYSSLLSGCGEDLFIYDNSPSAQHPDSEGMKSGWTYVSDPENGGISKAYNSAARYALENGYQWMLFLDQDTVFPANILDEYKEIIGKYPGINLIAPAMKMDEKHYMSPVKVRFHIGRPSCCVPQGKVSLYEYSPINSGLAVNVAAFHQAGGYNENVKLDFSDYQFIERFRKYYPELYVMRSVCFQSFSNVTEPAERKLRRFEQFCDCLKHCERTGRFDSFCYSLLVIKRMFALMCQTRSLQPVRSVFTKYF